MTPERAKELIPILQAVANGKEFEYWGKMAERWVIAEASRITIIQLNDIIENLKDNSCI